MEYKLDDTVIGNIVQLLQLAMFTGTDVSDHFRMIRLTPSELTPDKLNLAPEYAKEHEERIKKLTEEAEVLSAAQTQKEQGPGFINN